mmetsp:Transcript_27839/g.93633  ORF Transcript_27839/g.93633 Transcript_27839/m.93633 type:complete len:217 (-) Transcript_27839:136-786(-)
MEGEVDANTHHVGDLCRFSGRRRANQVEMVVALRGARGEERRRPPLRGRAALWRGDADDVDDPRFRRAVQSGHGRGGVEDETAAFVGEGSGVLDMRQRSVANVREGPRRRERERHGHARRRIPPRAERLRARHLRLVCSVDVGLQQRFLDCELVECLGLALCQTRADVAVRYRVDPLALVSAVRDPAAVHAALQDVFAANCATVEARKEVSVGISV